jgi:hypothetical protein
MAIAIAVAWAVVCVAWALAYPRAVDAAGASGWAEGLAGELSAARDDRERVIYVNDALREIEHVLDARARLPTSAAALAAVGSLLAMVGGVLHAPRIELLGCVGAALIGVLGCLAARRLGHRRARAVRVAVDARVRTLVGDLYDVEVVLPAARHRRRTSSRTFERRAGA